MKNDLKISILQTSPIWEEPILNQNKIDRLLQGLNPETDLLILPEMFSTGFTHHYSEQLPYSSLNWMKNTAKKSGITIYGSVAVSENDLNFNRGYWVTQQGEISTYDKKHLFKYGKEHFRFTPGNNQLRVSIKGWEVMPLICYDLRFPEWSRNKHPYYDILIYIASWPDTRIEAWTALLKARAIENQCYVIGVNRVGKDGYNLTYPGKSVVFNFDGTEILKCTGGETLEQVTLNYNELIEFRKAYPFLDDQDHRNK